MGNVSLEITELNNGETVTEGLEPSIKGNTLTISPGSLDGVDYPEGVSVKIRQPPTFPFDPGNKSSIFDKRVYSILLLANGKIEVLEEDGDFPNYTGDEALVAVLAIVEVERTGNAVVRYNRFTLDKKTD